MYENGINIINWVSSALSMVSTLHALNTPHLDALKCVMFGGESMPTKQLNRWRAEYPDVRFINLYGPTEVTDTCTFYEVSRKFENTENLPMGNSCENKHVFLLDENNELDCLQQKNHIEMGKDINAYRSICSWHSFGIMGYPIFFSTAIKAVYLYILNIIQR